MDENAVKQIADTVAREIKAELAEITLDEARTLSEQVRKRAEQMGVKAVVAISNRSANPILVECMDDSYIASFDVAVSKAFTATSLKMSTSDLKPLAQPGGSLYGIQFTNGGKIAIFGGGQPLKNSYGRIVGGLGVSGGTEKQDAELAAYGKELFEKGRR
ncbi:MAG: heme-binding protein [Ruminococcaceae bacterium]|nr:heme-binding protein [Oscillospiraceae bacterium]